MAAPEQGDVGLLDDAAAWDLLVSTVPAHLAYAWSDGTRATLRSGSTGTVRGRDVQPVDAPEVKALTQGASVAVTIHGADWPFATLSFVGQSTSTRSQRRTPVPGERDPVLRSGAG